jgi:hypothetical protein
MTSFNKLNISIVQTPNIIRSLEGVSLDAELGYDEYTKNRELVTGESQILIEWLYSTDAGKTFKKLNATTNTLNIQIDTLNINFVYKLKATIQRPDSGIIANQGDYQEIVLNSDNNFIATNQEQDQDSEVYYSGNLTLKHNLDLEDIILGMSSDEIQKALSEQSVILSIIANDGFNELDTDTEEQAVEDTLQPSSITFTGDDLTSTQGLSDYGMEIQGLYGYCYFKRFEYVCGAEIEYCVGEFWSFIKPAFCPTQAESCSQGCILTKGAWTAKGTAGTWQNVQIEPNSYKWCSSFSNNESKPTAAGTCSPTNEASVMSCANDGSYGIEPIYKRKCIPWGGNSSCPGLKAKRIQGKPGKCTQLWGVPYPDCYEFDYKDDGGLKLGTNCGPCKGPRIFYDDPQQVKYSCNHKLYLNRPSTTCDDDIIYKGDCDNTPISKKIGPPTATYSDKGITVTVTAKSDDDKTLYYDQGGQTDLPTGPYELPLRSQTAGAGADGSAVNGNFDNSITVTVLGTKEDECDMFGLDQGEDPWGMCIQGGDCVKKDIRGFPIGIDPSHKCFKGSRYYKISTGGKKSFPCAAHCAPRVTPASVMAPIVTIMPLTSRPTAGGVEDDLYTLAEAKAKVEKDNAKNAYWLKTYRLVGTSKPCYKDCNSTTGAWQVQVFQGVGSIHAGEDLSLHNACVNCGCDTDADCDGCSVCCDGLCVDYPSTVEQSACHPCAAIPSSVCCQEFDLIGNKTVACADPKKCEECIPFPNSMLGTFPRTVYDPNDPRFDCCNGVVYDPRCEECDPIHGTVREKCRLPYECRLTGETTTWVDEDGFEQQSDNYHCIIPPCPACEIEADDYDTTGDCISYNDTPEAKENCKACTPIDNPDYPLKSDVPLISDIYSTLDEGQECCQTGATTFVPCSNCCADSETGYNTCCPGAEDTCCDGACYQSVAGRTTCCNGKEAAFEDACNLCSFDQYGQQESKCDTYYSCCTKTVSGVEFFTGCYSNAYCDCQTCKGGKVVDVESDDPDDCCYAYAAAQSIFYEP